MSRYLQCLLLLLAVVVVHSKRLETVRDKELLSLIKSEQYVVVLFGKPNCGRQCSDLEHELGMAREVLVDSIGAWVVKADETSFIPPKHSIKNLPAVLFFRGGGAPMLYSGPPSKEDLLSTIQSNLEPLIKHLDDESFEHLTQASSGATTGDWLLLFHQSPCSYHSSTLESLFEGVGSRTKGRLNVAMVDIGKGVKTRVRFSVNETPTVLLLHHGRYYEYTAEGEYSIEDLINFAVEGGWRNSKGIPVPVPPSPFDELTEYIAAYLQQNPHLLKAGALLVSLLLLGGVARKWKPTTGKKRD